MIFQTKLEGAIVTVHWSYDRDDHGIYNTGVDKVIYQGVDIMPCLSDDVCEELDNEGLKLHEMGLHDD